ncbi:MAG: hypothetical protein HWN65_23420 [Candidatus Helarchaeota archaeon]|nr:hypothetical protein [Candidatus Helarchaeota archaeon]
MAEISKGFKIIIIVSGAVALFYGIWWTFLTEAYYTMIGGTNYDPPSVRGQGGTLILLGIFNLLAGLRLEWDRMKYYIQFGMSWLVVMIILNIVNFFGDVMTPAALMLTWMNIAILAAFLVLFVYFYLQEEKKS